MDISNNLYSPPLYQLSYREAVAKSAILRYIYTVLIYIRTAKIKPLKAFFRNFYLY